MRRTLLAVAVASAALFACHDATPTDPTTPALARDGAAGNAFGAAGKVAVCHAAGSAEDPKFHEISVGASAVADHLDEHGDYLVTPRTPCPPPPVVNNVRLCKALVPALQLERTFAFDVNGETITLQGGTCADRTFRVGTPVTIRETAAAGTTLDAISITPSVAGGFDLPTATATIVAGIDVATVAFTNRVLFGALRICKSAMPPDYVPGRSFLFMISSSLAPPRFYSVQSSIAGFCRLVDTFPVGTRVGIMEEVPFLPGARVTNIGVVPADRLAPGSVNLSTASVSVIIGAGDTDVHYTNDRPVGNVSVCVVGPELTGTVRVSIFAGYLDGPFGREVPINGCVGGFVETTGLLIGSQVLFGLASAQLPAGVRVASVTVQPSVLPVVPGPFPDTWQVQIGPATTIVTFTLMR